jgi:hypothetical protein
MTIAQPKRAESRATRLWQAWLLLPPSSHLPRLLELSAERPRVRSHLEITLRLRRSDPKLSTAPPSHTNDQAMFLSHNFLVAHSGPLDGATFLRSNVRGVHWQ